MDIHVKPVLADAEYQVEFKTTYLEGATEPARFDLTRKILKQYGLILNDLTFDANSASNKLLKFRKFYEKTLFDVSYGLDQIVVLVRRVENKEQLYKLLSGLYNIIKPKDDLFKTQKFILRRHLETVPSENAMDFMNGLQPLQPQTFIKSLIGKGLIHHYLMEEHNLNVQFTVANSMAIPNGLYLSIDATFEPNQYDFIDGFKVSEHVYLTILNDLRISVVEDGSESSM